jgi:predicted transcriptional regulator YheO
VAIHDITDPSRSIIWIAGNVTGREIGDGLNDLQLEMLRRGRTQSVFSYTAITKEGKTFKSAIIWLRTPEGEIFGAFCINMEITGIRKVMDFIQALAPDPLHVSEFHPYNLRDSIADFLVDYETWTGIPIDDMNKDDRLDLVKYLDDRGVFHVRNAVGIVADRMGISRKTIYNYLKEIAEEGTAS